MNNYIKILPALFVMAGYNIDHCDAMQDSFQLTRKKALTPENIKEIQRYTTFEQVHNSIIQVIDYILEYDGDKTKQKSQFSEAYNIFHSNGSIYGDKNAIPTKIKERLNEFKSVLNNMKKVVKECYDDYSINTSDNMLFCYKGYFNQYSKSLEDLKKYFKEIEQEITKSIKTCAEFFQDKKDKPEYLDLLDYVTAHDQELKKSMQEIETKKHMGDELNELEQQTANEIKWRELGNCYIQKYLFPFLENQLSEVKKLVQ